MATPLSIGTTAIAVALINKKRAIIRFQNTGLKDIYIKKIPLTGVIDPVSATNYEVLLPSSHGETDEGAIFETNSVNAFQAVAVTPGSTMAVYETVKV